MPEPLLPQPQPPQPRSPTSADKFPAVDVCRSRTSMVSTGAAAVGYLRARFTARKSRRSKTEHAEESSPTAVAQAAKSTQQSHRSRRRRRQAQSAHAPHQLQHGGRNHDHDHRKDLTDPPEGAESQDLVTPNEELRKAICLAAVLSEVVGATCGAECAASVVGALRDSFGQPTTTFDIISQMVSQRRQDWKTYGDGWLRLGGNGVGKLARHAAEAWETGMAP